MVANNLTLTNVHSRLSYEEKMRLLHIDTSDHFRQMISLFNAERCSFRNVFGTYIFHSFGASWANKRSTNAACCFLVIERGRICEQPVDLSEYPDTLVKSRLRRLNDAMPCMALKSFCPVDESAGRSVERS